MRQHLIISVIIFLFAGAVSAQTIVQSRGVDARVDYASLLEYGPWDDRNYKLNQDDLALLGENELELSIRAPLFYRIEIRKRFANVPTEGPSQYPRSTLPRFLTEYGGFLIDGMLYRQMGLDGNRFSIDTSKPWKSQEEYENAGGKSLTGDVRVTSPVGAAESAVAICPTNPDLVVAGSNGPGSGQNMHYSADGGETWSAAAALPYGGTCCDPTVAWSSDGTKAYTATLGSNVYIYRSADGGQNWDDLVNEPGSDARREVGSGVDKEYLHVDTLAGSACLDTVYLTWHEGNTMMFSRSIDMAHTWSPKVVMSTSTQRGIGSDITSDTSGRVHYIWPGTTSKKIYIRSSTDCGVTWGSAIEIASTQAGFDFPIPSMDNRYAWVYVGAGADLSNGAYGGSIYASWTDTTAPDGSSATANHARIQVAYSRDGGATWNISTPHETDDMESVDRWNQWLAVGLDGTVHVVFYDTRNDPTRTSVDLYWSTSTDGGVSWGTPAKLSSEISPHMEDGFQFGDYNGLDVVMSELIAVFSDNRNESGGTTDSVDIYAAGRTVAGGPSIFADDFESNGTGAWSSTVP
jgi:BNR/Asp-box repeat